jgi:hypothetical protein
VEFELLHAGGRTDGWTNMTKLTRTRLINHKPLSTAAMHSVSFVAALGKAVVAEYAGGCRLSARTERIYALLWDYSHCFSFHATLYPVFTLLRCDAAQVGFHRRFETTGRSRLLGSSSDGWYLFTSLKNGAISCTETSVNDYQSPLRNNPEQRKPHLHRGGSLKSRKPVSFLF